MVYKGDFVIFTPSKNIVVSEPIFTKTHAIIDLVNDNQTEVCLTTFDGRKFQGINILENIKKITFEENEVWDVIYSFYNFHDKFLYKTNSAMVMILFDDMYDRVEHVFSFIRKSKADDFWEIINNIENTQELLMLYRDKNWTCPEMSYLETIKNYCKFFISYFNTI